MTTTTTAHDLMTRREAAEYLRVSKWFLDTARERGPVYSQAGKIVRYRRADLDQWIADHAITAAAAPEPAF